MIKPLKILDVQKQEEYNGKIIRLNEFHCNAIIKGAILSADIMKKHGFREQDNYFCKFKPLCDEIELFVYIYKDNPLERVNIEIIDDNFCQPYDYQSYLEKNPNMKYALKVQNLVEKEIALLQEVGILSGHIYGEYI